MKSVMDEDLRDNFSLSYPIFEDFNTTVLDALSELSNWEYRLAVPFILFILALAGTLGNGLVVLVFVRNKVFRTITNMFLMNLAVTDLLTLIICVPIAATNYYKGKWIFGNILCKFVQYMMTVCLSLHVLTLTAVGIDRYLAIVHPILALSFRTKRRCIYMIIVIWLLSFLAFGPVLAINNEKRIDEEFAMCLEELEPTNKRVYATAMFVLFYAIPQLLLLFCYAQIVFQMKSQVKAKKPYPKVTIVSIKRRGRLVKLVFIVAFAFALCWLPLHVAVLAVSYENSDSNFIYHLQMIAPCLMYANSTINPFIYSFMSKTFRRYFKASFQCTTLNISSSLLVDDAVVTTHDRRHGGIELRAVRNRATQTALPFKPRSQPHELKPMIKHECIVTEETADEKST